MNSKSIALLVSEKFHSLILWLRNHPWVSAVFALLLLKGWMLYLGRDQIVQEHWRIMRAPRAAWREIVFSVLIGLSILVPVWAGGRLRVARAIKGGLIGFAVAWAFLMPQIAWRSYAYAMVMGTVSLWELRYNIAVDLFFGAPFFSLHLAALTGAWFVSRKVRDDRVFLSVLAVSISVIYGTLSFRYSHNILPQDLGFLGMLLICGIGTWLFRNRYAISAKSVWVFPVSITGGLLLLSESIERPQLGFTVAFLLLGLGFAWLLSKALSVEGSVPGLLFVFWAYAFFISVNIGYSGCPNYTNAVRYGLLLGRYVADDIVFVVLCFLLCQRLNRRGIVLYCVATLLYLTAAYVDVNYFKESGRRFSGFMLEMGGGTGLAVKMVAEYFTFHFFLTFIGLAALSFLGPILALRAGLFGAKKSIGTGGRWVLYAVFFLVVAGWFDRSDVFEGAMPRNVIAGSQFYRGLRFPEIPQAELEEGFCSVGIPLRNAEPCQQPLALSNRNNLVLVILESMGNKQLSLFGGEDETQPLLSEYAERMVRYPNVFCDWPSSNHARSAIWSGLYPIRPYLTQVNPRISRSSLTEILKEHGYYNAIFYSSDRNYTRLNDYMGHRGIDLFEDKVSLGAGQGEDAHVSWGVREDVTLDAMKRFLDASVEREEPFSMTYIPACPHMPFDTLDERFEVFDEGSGRLDGNYTGVYKNQLLYMDWILHSLLAHLDQTGLSEDTLVVMVNDHGEFVNINKGGVGHGWTSIPPATNIPLIVLPPGYAEGEINTAIGSQVDVLPTILDYLHLSVPENMPLQGVSLRGLKTNTRRIYLGSYQDFSVIDGEYFYNFPCRNPERVRCHAIVNEGAKTSYVKQSDPSVEEAESLKVDYERFSVLQESLIRNYENYGFGK
jgi:hypothetical protein